MVCPSYEALFNNKKEWITDILQHKWGVRALRRQSQKTTCCMSEKSPSAVILEPKKWKNWCWSWSCNALATWCKQLTHWKDPDVGKDWGQKEKRVSEDKMAGWRPWCNWHEIGQTPGDGEGQGGLACCSPWSHTESDMTGQLNDHKKRLPGGARGKESVCQCRRCKRCGFDPWVKKIPWSKKWHPTPVFLPGKFHGQRSVAGYSPMGLWRVRHDWATEHTDTHICLCVCVCVCVCVHSVLSKSLWPHGL